MPRHESPVVFVGPLPPPVDGQTLATAAILEALRSRGVLCLVSDTSKPDTLSWKNTSGRIFRMASASVTIAIGRLRGAKHVYIGALANRGLIHSALCALLARLLGYEIVVRHDASSYIRQRTLRMGVLAGFAGRSALHVTLANSMSEHIRVRYADVRNTLALGNAFVVQDASPTISDASRELRLGHLSNLSAEKGLVQSIDVLRRLLRQGVGAKLTLAGPVRTRRDREIIEKALSELDGRLTYSGPLWGEGKARFFQEVNVFLFPSLYRNEAQPIVCLEAMAAGVPVIAYDWGYVGEMLSEGGGFVVDRTSDFAEQALAILMRWVVEPRELRAASTQAHRRFLDLRHEANEALGRLLTALTD